MSLESPTDHVLVVTYSMRSLPRHPLRVPTGVASLPRPQANEASRVLEGGAPGDTGSLCAGEGARQPAAGTPAASLLPGSRAHPQPPLFSGAWAVGLCGSVHCRALAPSPHLRKPQCYEQTGSAGLERGRATRGPAAARTVTTVQPVDHTSVTGQQKGSGVSRVRTTMGPRALFLWQNQLLQLQA